MAKKLQLRRGTTSQHSSFTGAVGEVTVDTDKDILVVHDGSTAGGFPTHRDLKGADIASADPLVIVAGSNYFIVTGTTGFNDMTVAANTHFFLEFAGALVMTHVGGTLDLPSGANITTAAGDVGEFFATAANVVTCVNYTKASGKPVKTDFVNADINASAAIAQSKLVDIVNADVDASAAIATSKISGAVTSIASHGLGSLATLSSVDTAQLAADAVDGTKIADDSLDSEHYVDGSIDDAHLATGISSSKISGAVTNIASHGLGTSATVDTGTSANQIVKLDGNAKIPAVDGSQLTNLPASGKTITESTNPPALTTNPSDGVGALYLDKNLGELYCCTDATSNANVWTNIGEGEDHIEPYQYGGLSFGWCCGGSNTSGYVTSQYNIIDRTSFASDANSADWGDLTRSHAGLTGSSSSTHGYQAGGTSGQNSNQGYTMTASNIIDKFALSSNANSTDVGDMPLQFENCSGHKTATHGYTACGEYHPSAYSHTYEDTVHKYSFSSDGNATTICDQATGRTNVAGATDGTYGYSSGGGNASGNFNVIERFHIANESNGTDVGDLLATNSQMGNASSKDYGYCTGGGDTNVIQRFSFAASANATDVADLQSGCHGQQGTCSRTFGYSMGNRSGTTNMVEKYPFASNSNSTDVGDLTQSRYAGNGTNEI